LSLTGETYKKSLVFQSINCLSVWARCSPAESTHSLGRDKYIKIKGKVYSSS